MEFYNSLKTLKFRNLHFRWLLAADIFTNLIPIIGLLFLDWRIFSVMILYFSDMVVFFVLFLFWFIIASNTRVIKKIFSLFAKLAFFVTFLVTQAYFIFVFTGQYYFSRKSMGYDVIVESMYFDWILFFQEILAYILVLLPKFIQEDTGLLIAILIFLANHIFVLSSPDNEILLSGFGKFLSKIGFPTFAIIVISITNLLGLIGTSMGFDMLAQIALWVTIFFILLNAYYDIKALIVSRAGTTKHVKAKAYKVPSTIDDTSEGVENIGRERR